MMQIADQQYSTLKQSIAGLHKLYEQNHRSFFIKTIETILIFLTDIDDISFGVKCGVFSCENYIIIHYNALKKLLPDNCTLSRAEINHYLKDENFIKETNKELFPILIHKLNHANIAGNLWKNLAVFKNQPTNGIKSSNICYDNTQYSDDESFSRQPEILLPI